MIDREISRRQMLAATASTVAGLTLATSNVSLGQEKQCEKKQTPEDSPAGPDRAANTARWIGKRSASSGPWRTWRIAGREWRLHEDLAP